MLERGRRRFPGDKLNGGITTIRSHLRRISRLGRFSRF